MNKYKNFKNFEFKNNHCLTYYLDMTDKAKKETTEMSSV